MKFAQPASDWCSPAAKNRISALESVCAAGGGGGAGGLGGGGLEGGGFTGGGLAGGAGLAGGGLAGGGLTWGGDGCVPPPWLVELQAINEAVIKTATKTCFHSITNHLLHSSLEPRHSTVGRYDVSVLDLVVARGMSTNAPPDASGAPVAVLLVARR